MEDMSSLKILDDFLKKFISQKEDNYRASIGSFVDIKYENSPSLADIDMILNKLIKDGFVVRIKSETRSTNDIVHDYFQEISNSKFQLTLEGKIFSGYQNTYRTAQRQNRIEMVKSWLLIFGTWIAGIGSLSLVFWEIYKYYLL